MTKLRKLKMRADKLYRRWEKDDAAKRAATSVAGDTYCKWLDAIDAYRDAGGKD